MQATKQADKLSANNLLLVLVLMSFIIVGVTALVSKTLVVGLIRDTKVLKAENLANNTLKDDVKAAPQLVSSYQSLGPTANTLDDALPTSSNFPGIIVAMENMSLDSALTLKSVSPGFNPIGSATDAAAAASSADSSSATVEAPKPVAYTFNLVFDGSYTSLQKMLGDLELYDRPMRVQSIKLSGNGSSLSGTIDVQTFYQAKATLPIATETIK